MRSPPARADKVRFETIASWCRRHPYWALTFVTVAALLPFLSKPFNIDDPLFVWTARQIQSHPAIPYGFEVNWFGFSQPMWQAMQNPPLMSYYLAMAAGVFGWSETGLHLACLLPAVAVVLGTYRLAKNHCRWPLLAALATLFAPGFLVSATSVMCDVTMLSFWIWAVVFWTEGIKQDDSRKLSAAGTLVALAMLTKFTGLCLVPLLAAHGWIEKRNIGRWAAFLLIPLAALAAHECWTRHFYGQAHFLASSQYNQKIQTFLGPAKLFKAFNALTFTGGCFAAALFCAPFLWNRRVLLWFTVGGTLLTALAVAGGMMSQRYYWLAGNNLTVVEMQLVPWTVGGVCVLALALAAIWKKRDALPWLLALWVLGIFAYTAFVYFMANGRALLPMAPAVAILIARRLGQNRQMPPAGIIISLIACAALSLLAAQADFQQAETARESAQYVCAKQAGKPGKLWFGGHWGFQYYMQSAGARPLGFSELTLMVGDTVVMPELNSVSTRIDPAILILQEEFSSPDFSWLATLNPAVGAGFHANIVGPLPFAFGSIPPELYSVYRIKSPAKDAR